ncbi:mannosyl phosphorylinositol ceramide synthase SUR1, putative [Talaromyces stipitatus ATCC 10500]|uniref:Mannosyl phosphorylinositol ceramide synthase SUR1, putative n=1 Tax=Talaromyces stipitatus (strain ATCC 10500 / CBS 375.48 / QM 6759 / NRRL 1006) TaxID=441959 RepID=B8MT12_TALSN|nr:mannosyl phosphorylinositol ceramide synthase SUR1, putative [Talaromyces stipitatus ATCC 10500]EED12036.1 mannosyl phosphorylinositol ceramide synthase SUR1, putative [Talaromyces stipitatus ATCC 10500]
MASVRVRLFTLIIIMFLLSQRWWLPLGHIFFNLVALSSRWHYASAEAFISKEHDDFDVTFASYAANQSTSGFGYGDVIPPIMHHINLGSKQPRPEWMAARDECIRYHPHWKAYIWDDGASERLVREEFPHLKDMWDNYRFPVERVDALRYMILQTYGGVVLDFDLSCKRSLGPLRRFEFVAPAAHPTGFSIGFMMSSQGNPFVQELVNNLPRYNYVWFFLPYVAVMFSTGCHYASTIFTLQEHHSTLRILGGIPGSPHLHMLNGFAETPLFRHLGSSSWHSFDASLINWLGHLNKGSVIGLTVVSFMTSVIIILCLMCLRRNYCSTLRSGSSIDKYCLDSGITCIKEA